MGGKTAASHLSLVLYKRNFLSSNMLSKPVFAAPYSLCSQVLLLNRLIALIFAKLVAYLYFLL